MLSVVILSLVMLSVVNLHVVMLNVVNQRVVMLNVMAPLFSVADFYFSDILVLFNKHFNEKTKGALDTDSIKVNTNGLVLLNFFTHVMEQCVLDTNAGKQLS
jgi:hypothetical protein